MLSGGKGGGQLGSVLAHSTWVHQPLGTLMFDDTAGLSLLSDCVRSLQPFPLPLSSRPVSAESRDILLPSFAMNLKLIARSRKNKKMSHLDSLLCLDIEVEGLRRLVAVAAREESEATAAAVKVTFPSLD